MLVPGLRSEKRRGRALYAEWLACGYSGPRALLIDTLLSMLAHEWPHDPGKRNQWARVILRAGASALVFIAREKRFPRFTNAVSRAV